MDEQIRRRLHKALPKDLIIDLFDAMKARALAAHDMIRDHAGLDSYRARVAVGRVRFPMQEKSFYDICLHHGGRSLDADLIPGSDLKIFQPFMRFEYSKNGIVLGFASMPEAHVVPSKNLSRAAGVTLNYNLQPRLDFDGASPKAGDVFALFMTARDPAHAGKVAEVAIGVIDDQYSCFLYYETVEDFLAGYAEDPAPTPMLPGEREREPLVRLKAQSKPFVAPEARAGADDKKKKDDESA